MAANPKTFFPRAKQPIGSDTTHTPQLVLQYSGYELSLKSEGYNHYFWAAGADPFAFLMENHLFKTTLFYEQEVYRYRYEWSTFNPNSYGTDFIRSILNTSFKCSVTLSENLDNQVVYMLNLLEKTVSEFDRKKTSLPEMAMTVYSLLYHIGPNDITVMMLHNLHTGSYCREAVNKELYEKDYYYTFLNDKFRSMEFGIMMWKAVELFWQKDPVDIISKMQTLFLTKDCAKEEHNIKSAIAQSKEWINSFYENFTKKHKQEKSERTTPTLSCRAPV
ncbi:hypothetical protein Lgee_1306 [Legionella geestiana]|uniref:Uncharacterized protein n=1 Tax=Legionella geestiana TaxID=45065 RepID=A0A0W0TU86_9GAMM|nr:hypothetical protein [Legionella geestiana]KTC99040.1 hypothetical protein Lgee_1306 [Legionella geestiana]QBS12629.1 hypothetical protein E4T54_07670 [Legionella geestiana]QDQ39653.1 hypothetical protein E3226_004180 [Legionella geestiana]STX54913.1 Uncharacterised protein [Legionella geestiana]